MAKIAEESDLELELVFRKMERSCVELERHYSELELELEWGFRKMEWSWSELELHIAGVAHL